MCISTSCLAARAWTWLPCTGMHLVAMRMSANGAPSALARAAALCRYSSAEGDGAGLSERVLSQLLLEMDGLQVWAHVCQLAHALRCM
eukprot:203629-Chlamydomonas_euryale.AAC.2